MMWTRKLTTKAGLKSSAAGFARDESGSMTIFAVAMFMMMLLVGGIGVDLMRNEMERTRMQATVDRAVLAAADLDQPLDPEAVVRDYFDKSGMSNYLSSVAVDEGLNFRTVTAQASSTTPTQFMRLMGVDELPVPAIAQAEERVPKVEISMVLDISGSMRDNNKMQNLRDAAGVFLDSVLRPETEEFVSVNLVPYSEHVNVGQNLFNVMSVNQVHSYSHCIEIPDGHFNDTSFVWSATYQQAQHFQWNYDGYNNYRNDTICPRYSYEEVTLMSNEKNDLKSQINQFQPRAGTSIFLGMKWGVTFLDPGSRSVVNTLGQTYPDTIDVMDRPANWDDLETLKTVVLMTDGEHDRSLRISNFAYRQDSHYAHWNKYNFNWYLSRYVYSYNRPDWYYEKYNKTKGDALLDNICDAAKAQNIVIWTIGFEVEDHGANVMRDCASSPSHFFRVEGVEITEAFEAIGKQINQLRLTQ